MRLPNLLIAVFSATLSYGFAQRSIADKFKSIWQEESKEIYANTKGDALIDKAHSQLALKLNKTLFKKIRSSRKFRRSEKLWALLLNFNMNIEDSKTVAMYARAYLKYLPKGENTSYARYFLALHAIKSGKSDAVISAAIKLFDFEAPHDYRRRGTLRSIASEKILFDFQNITWAKELLDEAIDLPKSKEELELEKRNHGDGYHAWWQRDRKRLKLFSKSFDYFGGRDLSGKPVYVKNFLGKVLLIEFWAEW